MKRIFILAALLLSVRAFAHDEGHGPKLTDAPKHGGVLAPVIKLSDADIGAKASVMYKSELVRSEDGAVKLYLYTPQMQALPLASFNKKAQSLLMIEKKKKIISMPFELKQDGEYFTGNLPANSVKPYTVDIRLKDGKQDLMIAFENLD